MYVPSSRTARRDVEEEHAPPRILLLRIGEMFVSRKFDTLKLRGMGESKFNVACGGKSALEDGCSRVRVV